jgi:NAD(P)-dependent dehydrogenase (short-subunit alcohol dehydrogenase family)
MSDGAVVVVTGAASGIGAGIAALLAARGATVVGLDRAPAPAAAAARGPWLTVDLSSPSSIRATLKHLPDRIDALCNVAGMHPRSAEAHEIVAVNYLGTRLFTECVASRMAPGAAIVNMASVAGAGWQSRLAIHRELISCETFEAGSAWLRSHPVPAPEGYTFSKEALIAWTVLTAPAWLPRGVRMNALAPGPVQTPAFVAFEASRAGAANPDVDLIGRPGRIDEVARVAAFMCAEESGWVNGAVLPVDGGLQAAYLASGREPAAL